jgi:hypothetical protein
MTYIRAMPYMTLLCSALLLTGSCTAEAQSQSPTGLYSSTASAARSTSLPSPPIIRSPFPPATARFSSTPTPKPTITSLPSTTALPTYPSGTAGVSELMANNGGCELPCWWGIVPGASTWSSVLPMLQSLEPVPWPSDLPVTEPPERHEFTFSEPYWPKGSSISLGASVRNDIIERLYIDIHELPGYSLSHMLDWLGVPDLIMVQPSPGPGGNGGADLILFSPSRGVLVRFVSNGHVSNGKFAVCFREAFGVLLWDPSSHIDFYQLGSSVAVPGLNPYSIGGFRSIEDALGLDPMQFTKKFINPALGGCMSLPIELWNEN